MPALSYLFSSSFSRSHLYNILKTRYFYLSVEFSDFCVFSLVLRKFFFYFLKNYWIFQDTYNNNHLTLISLFLIFYLLSFQEIISILLQSSVSMITVYAYIIWLFLLSLFQYFIFFQFAELKMLKLFQPNFI